MSLNSFRTGLGNITSSPVGKWTLFIVGALLVFSLVFSGLGNNLGSLGGSQPAARSGEDVIATVNGDPITRDDFETALSGFQNQLQMTGRNIGVAETPLLNSTVLDQLIGAKLQLQQAKQSNLTVSDAEVAKKRAEIVDASGLRQKLSLPPTASFADIDAALAKGGANQTIEQRLPDDTLRQLILLGDPQSGQPGKIQTAFNSGVVVTEADARQFYTKYHTRHILVDNKAKRTDAQAKVQAQEILDKAKKPGADFAALANQYSDDPGNQDPKTHKGVKGGDDGFIDETTQYVPEFKKAAFSLKPGQVTPDLVTSPQYGYFIIKLDATKADLPADFEKNKAKYLDQIKQQRAQAKYGELMASLKDSAKITVTDPALAGDRAFSEAGRSGLSAATQYQAAAADYQKALKGSPPAGEKAAISAALAQVYQGLHQTPQAIAAYEDALKSRDDPSLRMTLGGLYLQNKDNANAVKQFQQASLLAWNDQSTHVQLMMNYRQAGRPDLAAKEVDWLKSHQQAPGPAGLPGMAGAPGAAPVGQPAGSVHVTLPPGAKAAR